MQSYFGPYFPPFGLNTARYEVSLSIQCKCGKIRTKITPNTDTFHVLNVIDLSPTKAAINKKLFWNLTRHS